MSAPDVLNQQIGEERMAVVRATPSDNGDATALTGLATASGASDEPLVASPVTANGAGGVGDSGRNLGPESPAADIQWKLMSVARDFGPEDAFFDGSCLSVSKDAALRAFCDVDDYPGWAYVRADTGNEGYVPLDLLTRISEV